MTSSLEDVKLSTDVEVTSSSPDDKRLQKSWGYITAYPHEYLIHFRKGRFSQKSSGQGASCFKRRGDTVFIIPTSLKEIIFQANQLSIDNVENSATPLSLERNFIETALPAIAEALAKSMSNSRVNIIQGDGSGSTPFKFVLTEILDILRERVDGLEQSE